MSTFLLRDKRHIVPNVDLDRFVDHLVVFLGVLHGPGFVVEMLIPLKNLALSLEDRAGWRKGFNTRNCTVDAITVHLFALLFIRVKVEFSDDIFWSCLLNLINTGPNFCLVNLLTFCGVGVSRDHAGLALIKEDKVSISVQLKFLLQGLLDLTKCQVRLAAHLYDRHIHRLPFFGVFVELMGIV